MFTRSVFFLLIVAGCTAQKTAAPLPDTLPGNLRNHVSYLSADSLEGRRTGSKGEQLAAAYISNQFKAIGLAPKGTAAYYQSFDVAETKEIDPSTFLSVNGNTLQLGKDFFPFAFGAQAAIDAMPSIALMERGEPWFLNLDETLKKESNNPHFDVQDAVITKAKDAAKKGAIALFVYNTSAKEDGLSFNGKAKEELLTIPVVYVKKEAAKKYFSDPSALLKIKASFSLLTTKRTGTNVIGFVDNGAPYTVVLGAHYDHLGFGEDHNSRYTGAEKQIHNGADDNASGTAALIELARLVKEKKLAAHNYLFIAFSGEELGLYGSKYFTQHPTIDLRSINFMINMDMVGRLNDSSQSLTVGGYGTSPTWGELYQAQGSQQLFSAAQVRFDSSGTGPSDHTSFYLQNIPVLFYFTGLHTDYHNPTDDFDKINYNGQAGIVKHIYSLLQATDKKPQKLSFTKTREVQTTTTARFSVTLGIMPDYTYNGAGVRTDGVSDGKPAQKAGLKAGDIITAIGDFKINSMETYMQTLGKFKKGDAAIVYYTRNGQQMQANVIF